MNSVVAVLNQIIMLLLIAGCGLGLRLKGVFTDKVVKAVNTLIVTITWPCMALMVTQKEHDASTVKGFMIVLVVSTVALLLIYGLVYLLSLRDKGTAVRPVFMALCTLPNAGFVGLPIISAVYGDGGVVYLAAFIIGFNLVAWTVGVFTFTGLNVKAMGGILSPGFISAVLGTVLFLLDIRLPDALLSTVDQLGSANTPLAMLLLGARMDTLRPRQLLDGRLWVSSLMKLVVCPLATLLAMRLLNIPEMLCVICALLMAMPSASACQLLAEKYDGDVAFAAKGISVNTLLCIVTIPLLLLVAGV